MDFCFLLKIWVKILVKTLSGKFCQKLLDHTKKYATDTFKTALKRAIQKTAETTGDLLVIKLLIKLQKLTTK